MKKNIQIIGILFLAPTLWAEGPINDHFDRIDTEYSVKGFAIGKNWKNDLSMKWAIQNNMASANHNVSGEYVLYDKSLQTISGEGREFDLHGDVMGMFGGAWGGIAFNYQDPDNFYAVRFQAGTSTYQLVRVVEGRISAVVSKKDAIKPFSVGSIYTIKVTSSTPTSFNFEITETGELTVLNPTTSGYDYSSYLTKGHAGSYVHSAPGSAKPDVMV